VSRHAEKLIAYGECSSEYVEASVERLYVGAVNVNNALVVNTEQCCCDWAMKVS
jgi:hypothetical protein